MCVSVSKARVRVWPPVRPRGLRRAVAGAFADRGVIEFGDGILRTFVSDLSGDWADTRRLLCRDLVAASSFTE